MAKKLSPAQIAAAFLGSAGGQRNTPAQNKARARNAKKATAALARMRKQISPMKTQNQPAMPANLGGSAK